MFQKNIILSERNLIDLLEKPRLIAQKAVLLEKQHEGLPTSVMRHPFVARVYD